MRLTNVETKRRAAAQHRSPGFLQPRKRPSLSSSESSEVKEVTTFSGSSEGDGFESLEASALASLEARHLTLGYTDCADKVKVLMSV